MKFWTTLTLLLILLSTTANANLITISSFKRGSIQSNGAFNPNDGQSFTSPGASSGAGANSFMSYDLTNVAGAITEANLRIRLLGYNGESESGNIYAWGFSGEERALTRGYLNGSSDGQAVYSDLGSGVAFGTTVIKRANESAFIDIPLNQFALNDLNQSMGGRWIVGFSFDIADPTGFVKFSNGRGRIDSFLSIDVQEVATPFEVEASAPTTFGLFSTMAVFAAYRRKASKE